MYYVSLLRSEKDQRFYIGFSSNLKNRIVFHLSGFVTSTANRRPLKLVYYESYISEELARQREKNLKKFGSAYSCLIKRLGYNLGA